MNNYKYTKQLEHYKLPILNFFLKKNPKTYISFLNTKSTRKLRDGSEWDMGSRSDWYGAHLRAQEVKTNNKGKDFYDKAYGYYISFNTFYDEVDNVTLLTIREDLFWHWYNAPKQLKKYLKFLVVCRRPGAIFEVPFLALEEAIKDKNAFYRNKCLEAHSDFVFKLTDKVVSRKEDLCFDGLPSNTTYKEEWYQPKYIANYVYTTYRRTTTVLMHVYSKDGFYKDTVAFCSMGEAFAELTKHKKFAMSHSTLKRAIALHRVFETDKSFYYLSFETDHEEKLELTDVEIRATTTTSDGKEYASEDEVTVAGPVKSVEEIKKTFDKIDSLTKINVDGEDTMTDEEYAEVAKAEVVPILRSNYRMRLHNRFEIIKQTEEQCFDEKKATDNVAFFDTLTS